MKRIKCLLISICAILLVTACSKDTESKLFGKWQLQQVEINGVIQEADTVYFNFEHSLFMYQVYTPQADTIHYRYGYNVLEGENILHLELISNPRPVASFLPYTDWSSAKRTYTIDKLSGKQLILSSENKLYTFRKF